MIKMIAGRFGLLVDGIVKGMDKNSPPFEASEEQEARLVEQGLAEYVTDPAPIGFDDMPPEDGEITDLPDGVTGIPEYSEETSAKELREIGKLCGLTFKVGMSKADMIAALDAHIEANMVDGVEVNEDGEITVADGEDAPTFDPSEAVQ